MTAQKAWKFLAKEFRKKRTTLFNQAGLCAAIRGLHLQGKINDDVCSQMYQSLSKEGKRRKLPTGSYFFPIRLNIRPIPYTKKKTLYFSRRRAVLADKFAATTKQNKIK